MTEPTHQSATDPAADTSARADAPANGSLELPENLEAARKLRTENKRLRERLREMEGNYESAITRLGVLQHNEIERAAAEHLVDASDIWSAQSDPAAFLDDEYSLVDPEKVAEAAKTLLADKPHLGTNYNPTPPPPTNRPIEGLRPGAAPLAEPQPTPTWGSVLGR